MPAKDRFVASHSRRCDPDKSSPSAALLIWRPAQVKACLLLAPVTVHGYPHRLWQAVNAQSASVASQKYMVYFRPSLAVWRVDQIAHPTRGLYELRFELIIDFCSQPSYRHLNHIGIAVEIHVPYLGGDK